jgi:hypothetical protein
VYPLRSSRSSGFSIRCAGQWSCCAIISVWQRPVAARVTLRRPRRRAGCRPQQMRGVGRSWSRTQDRKMSLPVVTSAPSAHIPTMTTGHPHGRGNSCCPPVRAGRACFGRTRARRGFAHGPVLRPCTPIFWTEMVSYSTGASGRGLPAPGGRFVCARRRPSSRPRRPSRTRIPYLRRPGPSAAAAGLRWDLLAIPARQGSLACPAFRTPGRQVFWSKNLILYP